MFCRNAVALETFTLQCYFSATLQLTDGDMTSSCPRVLHLLTSPSFILFVLLASPTGQPLIFCCTTQHGTVCIKNAMQLIHDSSIYTELTDSWHKLSGGGEAVVGIGAGQVVIEVLQRTLHIAKHFK